MATLTCRCGFTIDNRSFPNNYLLIVYTDKEWDTITVGIDKISDLPSPSREVWKCPVCQRIYVFRRNDSSIPDKIYRLEDEGKA